MLDAVPLDSVTLQMLWDLKAVLLQAMAPQTVRHCFGLLRRAVIPVGKPTVLSGRGPDQAARRRDFFFELRPLRRPVGPGDGDPGAVPPESGSLQPR